MAAPMLVPLILLGGATIALAAASSKRKDAQPAGAGNVKTYTLDSNMPPPLRDQVLAALATEQDPAKLEAFGAAIASAYPLAAGALRQKAALLRAGTLPQNPVDLLTGVPDPPRTQVMQQLMGQNDPNALEAYARQLETQFPAAAAALRMKEAVLRGQTPIVRPPTPGPQPAPPPSIDPGPPMPSPPPIAPPVTPPPNVPVPPPQVLPPIPPLPIPVPPVPVPLPSVPPPLLGGLDPGMPPEMQKAVVGALTTESDPAKLEGFASAIQAQYPVSAGLLMAKAQALRLMRPPGVGPAPIPTPPSGPPIAPPFPLPSPVPVTTAGTYRVLAGDFPIKITQKLTGDGNRWHELIAANPQKKTGKDGNFVSLLPGEILKLPASWSAAPVPISPVGPAPALPTIPAGPVPGLPSLPFPVPSVPFPVPPLGGLGIPTVLPPLGGLGIPAVLPTNATGSYTVQSGDFPIKIAKKLTGDGNRWHELVAANPQKKTGADGNFASLLPGEVLHVPASWSDTTNALAVASGGSHAAHA